MRRESRAPSENVTKASAFRARFHRCHAMFPELPIRPFQEARIESRHGRGGAFGQVSWLGADASTFPDLSSGS